MSQPKARGKSVPKIRPEPKSLAPAGLDSGRTESPLRRIRNLISPRSANSSPTGSRRLSGSFRPESPDPGPIVHRETLSPRDPKDLRPVTPDRDYISWKIVSDRDLYVKATYARNKYDSLTAYRKMKEYYMEGFSCPRSNEDRALVIIGKHFELTVTKEMLSGCNYKVVIGRFLSVTFPSWLTITKNFEVFGEGNVVSTF